FHGRDLFAPVAAALAAGLPIEHVGPMAAPPVEPRGGTVERAAGRMRGQVLYRDAFGNLVTNIPGSWLLNLPARFTLEHRHGRSPIRRAHTYSDYEGADLLALVGSGGTVEIAVNAGQAAAVLSLDVGDAVILVDSQ
ncbi:MAG: SAM hydroxide adenosyltransferase, partial [bacterium]